MVYIKKALSPRAQEAVELIAENPVFHAFRDTDGMHLFAESGNATLSLVLPMAVWGEIRSLVEWVETSDGEGESQPILCLMDDRNRAISGTLPKASNEATLSEALITLSEDKAEQLDLPLGEISTYALLEAEGQQRLI